MADVEARLEEDRQSDECLQRITSGEKRAVKELPQLYDKIEEMGLTQEYCAYRDRWMEWRKGEATGASGELDAALLKKGFKGWYPNAGVWTFRRTLSYWIAVGFFIGSLFFVISSFLGCYPDSLGQYTFVMTKGGLLAGKFYFIICTYFMCVEAVNLRIHESDDPAEAAEEIFYWWPFYYKTALKNLHEAGAGPIPYYCAVSYFIGCLFFAVGLFAEFAPISESVAIPLKVWTFGFGSVLFVFGGICELIETSCFIKFKLSISQFAAVLDTIGSVFFLWGSVMFGVGNDYWGSFTFGVGSLLFLTGSCALILMWKDEQFGLSFFSAINHLISPQGDGNSFSWRGAVFVMIFGLAATLSVYDFMISLTDLHSAGLPDDLMFAWWTPQVFNSLLPCVVTHLILVLTSAMLRAPKESPFRQIYFGYRFLAVIMIANSGAKVGAALLRASEGRFLSCAFASLSPSFSTAAPVVAASTSAVTASSSTSTVTAAASASTIKVAAREVVQGFF